MNPTLNLKLQKVKDLERKVIIHGLPKGLVDILSENMEDGEYVLVPDIEEIKGSEGLKRNPKIYPEQITTNSATYQQVAIWTVGTKKAYLRTVAFANDTPATGNWQLKIQGDVVFTDKIQQNAFNLDMQDLELKEGDSVEILAKSDGVANIIFDGLIDGEEVGS